MEEQKNTSILSDHHGSKLKSMAEKNEKPTSIQKLSNLFSDNQWIKKESKGNKKYFDINENKYKIVKLIRCK